MKEDLFKDAPTGTLRMISDSGFINSDLFLVWIQHFKSSVKPSPEEPVLLLLDNHVSHRTLAVVNYCRENFIHLLSLPPHSSHRLQPLDKGFFGPLKSAYSEVCDNYLVTHPGKVITQSEVAGLFRKAYYKVSNIEKATNSFSTTGISPYNPNVFGEEDFAPSAVSDKPYLSSIALAKEGDDPSLKHSILVNSEELSNEEKTEHSAQSRVDSISKSDNPIVDTVPVIIEFPDQTNVSRFELLKSPITIDMSEVQLENVPISSIILEGENQKSNEIVTPYQIRPLPKMETSNVRRRNAQKSEILTSTPFKNSITITPPAPPSKANSVKRRLQCEVANVSKIVPSTSKSSKKSKEKESVRMSQTETPEEDVFCPGCDEKFVEPPDEDWIQCLKCAHWWHEACTYYSGGQYLCDFCN
ncbi:hypothetical protein PPYR_15391 [Photinus pyralis]|uniref:DDE-1 domain-containing protein n=1 Tax=Photinus pyralis TaxID=7054 RepID=A0A5N3ZYY1_PHOPY|nr:hypothetical protein PPYR_15391 [Photinus pyralis]